MKKIHIFRIILFSSIILLPILTMNLKENQVSEIDNRVLTNFSDIKDSDIKNGDITKNIESYVEDRIGFRDKMVSAYTIGMDRLFNDMVHPSYQYGEEGYIFAKLTAENYNSEFQEVFSSFIADFENTVMTEILNFYIQQSQASPLCIMNFTEGFNYTNKNLEYFLSLLKKNVNFYIMEIL